MGMAVTVHNLDEMCDLMCDNVLPAPEEPKYWIFTFGCGSPKAGMATKIFGTYDEARQKMFEIYGDKWAFQYSEENWEEMKADRIRMYPMSRITEVIE